MFVHDPSGEKQYIREYLVADEQPRECEPEPRRAAAGAPAWDQEGKWLCERLVELYND
jgi:hypothetical protein